MDIRHDGTYLGEIEPGDEGTVEVAYNENGDQPLHVCSGCGAECSDDEPDAKEECDQQATEIECSNCEGSGEVEEECPECGGSGKTDTGEDCPSCDGEGHIVVECEDCSGYGQLYRHHWEPNPLAWFKAAQIIVRPSQGTVKVNISVSDPRGAFTMEIWQTADGHLMMSVPYEGMPSPHMPLKLTHGGAYRLGHIPE